MSAKSFNFPKQLTPFIGRSTDLHRLVELLKNPECRLLTLVGAGGIGKTRLATQAGINVSNNFRNGTYYVGLQVVQSSDLLVSAIANALRFSLASMDELDVQLHHFLSTKSMLLVLDNFEHLMDGASILSNLLDAAPELKLIVTSREVLNLQEEWVFSVEGMDYPQMIDDPDFGQYSAVELFNDRAMRVNVSFSIDQEKSAVKKICELVGGMPLGLELAASWLRIMRANEVANEIQRSLDFLATSLRNIPERHRSMQAIFDHSWELLSESEKIAFKALSVFRGGFTHDAAEKVGDAPLSLLATLVDKSLLRHDSDGRYFVHELLRQFSEAKLDSNPAEAFEVRDRHCDYYADFLQVIDRDLYGSGQLNAADRMIRDIDNIQAAWLWAITHRKVEFFAKIASPIEYAFQFQGRYREGRDMFEASYETLEKLPPSYDRDLALALVSSVLAWFCIRFGDMDRALELGQKCEQLYKAHNTPVPSGQATDPKMIFGIVAAVRGDYDEAEQWYRESIDELNARNDNLNLPYSYLFLANVELSRGNYDNAQHYAEQAYMLSESLGNLWLLAYCLNELGNAARANGDLPTAKQYYEQCYAIREEFRDPEGMGLALNSLGYTMMLQDDYQQAYEYYQRSHRLYSDTSDRGGLGMALTGLGASVCGLGDSLAARQYFQQALRIALDIEYMPLMSFVLLNIGKMKLLDADKVEGIELLTFIQHHQISSFEHVEHAKQLLSDLISNDNEEIQKATETGKTLTLDAVVTNLLTRLSFDTYIGDNLPEIKPKVASKSNLVDPLTPRETEILKLIADGLTNPEIAETAFITVGTVKAHINSIYSKLDVQNRVQAVTRAQELGLV